MVKAWRERITIPTYEVGKPEKNPIFLEKRVYQGSSGVVYPYPVIESIADEKTDKTYNAVFLENEYIKVMVLPELGGRIQMAYDKIKQRHFIYYNQVIKPALVGLAGPWISGGIEFNWPQHHRPSTFMEVDCDIEEGRDGSVTVWVNERERMFHQQGRAGFTLRPGCAYLEIKGRLYNPTETPQTFLWWANPAVAVNEHYQSVFPPDVNAVFDHGKRAVSSFPIATGTYYKMDYSAGVDISNYKNIPVPTSYMVAASKYNFEGGYENDTHAGMLHVADHHFSPGKKQWTWGNGDFGRAWDRNLTDEDGPYIELMAGVYTENQPDFTWLMPYEEKQFTQYFLPYRELGIVKNASKDILLNVTDAGEGKARLQIFATSKQKLGIVLLSKDGKCYYSEQKELSPQTLFDEIIAIDCNFKDIHLNIIKDDRVVMEYEAEPDEVRPIPDAAEPALRPEEIKTCEQLFLTGLHLEQYRHATYSPTDYYEEALRRDPLDVRCNNALGLWYIRKGRFAKAEQHLRTAVKVLQKRNPNPYDGEPIYNLALCMKYQGKMDEAYDLFYKATWNAAWQCAGYMSCAQISVMRGDYEQALYEVEQALLRGWHNHKGRALKASILICLGRKDEALAWIDDSLKINQFNYGCLYEKGAKEEMKRLMHGDANNYDELALDFCAAGLWQDAIAVWQMAVEDGAVTPMTDYYMMWAEDKDENSMIGYEAPAITNDQETYNFCFPNRLEAILALDFAKTQNPSDAHPYYFLGNLYYDKRQYDLAQENWERAAELNPEFPTVWRNLALVYANKRGELERAKECMERAFHLDESDSRILMELDQLYKRMQHAHQQRLDNLQKYPALIAERDDLVLEEITLLNQLHRYEEAKAKLDAHIFHPWEGGEGKVSGQYQLSRLEMAKQLIESQELSQDSESEAGSSNDLQKAVQLLEECLVFPHSLGEGKLYGAQDNDFYYYMGVALSKLGKEQEAKEAWQHGTVGPTEPAAALYYNDAKPEKIYYAALCHRALGQEKQALSLFHKLVTYGEQHLFDKVRMDYFAVSLPDLLIWEDSLDVKNQIHCKFLLALGNRGLGNDALSEKYANEVRQLDINHPICFM